MQIDAMQTTALLMHYKSFLTFLTGQSYLNKYLLLL